MLIQWLQITLSYTMITLWLQIALTNLKKNTSYTTEISIIRLKQI